MPYEPLHHKYRPQTFAELVGQGAIAQTLSNALHQQKIAPAYLFTGARGTGKTSSARILAKSLNCLKSNVPTDRPCGVCEVCRAIANGSAMDVIEIDAASNTGVDNIRELIERAQFAPVQCRYKLYVVDECLTGDTLVQTREGLLRIDDPSLLGKEVLSYNDDTGAWEYKKVLRWLDRGIKPTLVIKTTNTEIRCTANHLIRCDRGWIPAGELKPSMKILSPSTRECPPLKKNSLSSNLTALSVAAAVAKSSNFPLASSRKLASNTLKITGRNTLINPVTFNEEPCLGKNGWLNWNPFGQSVLVAAENGSSSQNRICKIAPVSKPSKNTGKITHTKKITTSEGASLAKQTNLLRWSQLDRSASVAAESDWTFLNWSNIPASNMLNAIGKNTQLNKTITNCLLPQSELQNWNSFAPYALATVENDWRFQITFLQNTLLPPLLPFVGTGTVTPISEVTESGTTAPSNFSETPYISILRHLDLSTEPYWAMLPLPTPTLTADFPACRWFSQKNNENGWSTKLIDCQHSVTESGQPPIWDTEREIWRFTATLPAILNSERSSTWLNPPEIKRLSPWNGSSELLQKAWLGGIWTTAPSAIDPEAVQLSKSIQRDSHHKKTNSLSIGLQHWDIQSSNTLVKEECKNSIRTLECLSKLLENGYPISSLTLSQQWHTNLEEIEWIEVGKVEKVYDIEVEDNHNFVANGLTAHNCHMLSAGAMNALLKTLEEPPDRVVFVLATTDPQKVLPTIISRCQRFNFQRIALEEMVAHLSAIASKESIDIEPEAIHLVAQLSQGGLRDAESLLDQLSLLQGKISIEKVWDLVGAVPERDLLALVKAIAQDNPSTVLDKARHLMDRGREPLVVLQNLASFYRDLLIAKTAPQRNDLVAITPPTWAEMTQFVQEFHLSWILEGQKHLRSSELQVKTTSQPRLWLEVALLGLLPSAISTSSTEGVPVGRSVAPSMVIPQPTVAPPSPVKAPEVKASAPSEPSPLPAQVPVVPPSEPQTITPLVAPPVPEPVVQVTPPQPEQTAHAEETPSSQNLQQIWQTVITHLRPPGTQALLSQQGFLLAYSGQEARIGIRSEQLFRMAKERLPNVEAAFEAAFQTKIKVVLEVATPETTPPPAVQPPPQANLPPIAPPQPQQVPPPPVQPPVSAPPASPKQETPPLSPPPRATIDPAPEAIAPQPFQPYEEEDEVTKAAKSFAQFFRGTVVDLDNAAASESASNETSPPKSATWDKAASSLEPDDEDDVPF